MFHLQLQRSQSINNKWCILLILYRFDGLENISEGDTFLPNKSNGKIETKFTDVSMILNLRVNAT